MQYERVKGHGDTGQMGEGHVAKGGTIRRRGKSCFPRSTLVFAQRVQTVRPRPRPPCSPLLSVLAPFFLFSLSSEPVSCDVVVVAASTPPPPHTGDIPSAPPY